MTVQSLVDLIESLPLEDVSRTRLTNRVEEDGVTDAVLDDIEQLLADAEAGMTEELVVLAGERMAIDAYSAKAEHILEEARQEIDKIDAAEEAVLNQMEDFVDQLEAQGVVDNA